MPPGPEDRTFSSPAAPFVWLAAMNAFLLSPLFVERIRLGTESDLPLRLVLFSAAASVLWLALATLLVRRAFALHVILSPLYVLVVADLFAVVHYRTRLSASLLSVLLESHADARDFLAAHQSALLWLFAPALVFYVVGLGRIRPIRLHPHPRILALTAAALAALYVPMYFACGDGAHLAAAERGSPFGSLAQAWLAAKVHADLKGDVERTKDFLFGVTRSDSAPASTETYVLVIGESSRADHWGVYGYARDTTPRLLHRPNLVVFRNTVTQASYTTAAVPLMLTRASAEDPSRLRRERSVLALAREAGFASYWLSTQQREPFAGAVNRCSGDADTQTFLERQYDGELVAHLGRVLRDGKRKRLIVVHTMGSHYAYSNRAPPGVARFAGKTTGASRLAALRDTYDDTIVYTDQILAELVDTLEKTEGFKALLYVADHGENLEDDARTLFGHYLSNEYDLPVPMLFWYSNEFAERWADKVSAARRAAELRASTRSIFYTVADLMGARLNDPALETLSVVSPGYRVPVRFVQGNAGVFDYDARRRP
jgi:heptose-I-phosphate ethanolaminephosphotransferase